MLNKRNDYKLVTVIIRVINSKTDEIKSETTKIIDGPERRDWLKSHLAKTVMWAMLNNHYVEVVNKEDDKED